MVDLLPFLTNVIGLRDPHGKGHSNHVRGLSAAFGRNLDMSLAQIETLTFAAEIHDIGKIAINEFIINKPGRFTEAEYLMVQHHAELGASLIESLHLDPRIPLEARIIRITDTYDALTSNRGYRAAYTSRKALSIMAQEHRFFDPQLLEIFFKMQGVMKH